MEASATPIDRFGPAAARGEARSRPDLRLDPLGSGSDFTPFLQHLGIASLDLSYGGEDDGGIYHSIYDDFWWFTHFSDTSFVYGRALAQTVGTAIMRLADAEVLPIEFNGLADNLRRYGDEVAQLVEDRRQFVTERNRQLDEGVYPATSDPRLVTIPPEREADPPHMNFAPLQNALDGLTRSAARYDSLFTAIGAGDGTAYARAAAAGLNTQLLSSERRLTSPAGLPNRSWYRHLVYAPGFYTGYAVKTLPGVREANRATELEVADSEIERAAAALRDETALIDQIADLLERSTK